MPATFEDVPSDWLIHAVQWGLSLGCWHEGKVTLTAGPNQTHSIYCSAVCHPVSRTHVGDLFGCRCFSYRWQRSTMHLRENKDRNPLLCGRQVEASEWLFSSSAFGGGGKDKKKTLQSKEKFSPPYENMRSFISPWNARRSLRLCLTFQVKLNERVKALWGACFSLLPKSTFHALRYLNGMFSFGLMESRYYDQAEKVAMEVSPPACHYGPRQHCRSRAGRYCVSSILQVICCQTAVISSYLSASSAPALPLWMHNSRTDRGLTVTGGKIDERCRWIRKHAKKKFGFIL